MYTKFEITGTIEVVTGLHIGGSSTIAAIGAVDSSVLRDPISDLPMIPGSSLRGKIRHLLAQKYNTVKTSTHTEDAEEILRLFGTSSRLQPRCSRLLFSDSILSNNDQLRSYGLNSVTEVKFENIINRLTATASPRQIERVIRGAEFPLSLIYTADQELEIIEDITILSEGLLLLQYDYLGGNGSRGYGKVKLKNLSIKAVIGQADDSVLQECAQLLGKCSL